MPELHKQGLELVVDLLDSPSGRPSNRARSALLVWPKREPGDIPVCLPGLGTLIQMSASTGHRRSCFRAAKCRTWNEGNESDERQRSS